MEKAGLFQDSTSENLQKFLNDSTKEGQNNYNTLTDWMSQVTGT